MAVTKKSLINSSAASKTTVSAPATASLTASNKMAPMTRVAASHKLALSKKAAPMSKLALSKKAAPVSKLALSKKASPRIALRAVRPEF